MKAEIGVYGEVFHLFSSHFKVLRLEAGNKAAQVERGKLIERMKEKPKNNATAKEHRPPKEFEDKLRGALKKSDLETLKRDFNTMKEVHSRGESARLVSAAILLIRL